MFFEEVDDLKAELKDVKNDFRALKESEMPKFISAMTAKVDEALIMSESKVKHYSKLTIEKHVKILKEDLRKLAPLSKANDQII